MRIRAFNNIITKTDSYKVSHWKQTPPDTSVISSFFAARGGLFPSTLFFGLQYIIKRHLLGRVVDKKRIVQGREFWTEHFFGDGSLYNELGWRRIEREYGGRLPIVIRAIPEGTLVPTGNVLMTVENTDPLSSWLTNYLETLLTQVWYPSTTATNSHGMVRLIRFGLEETGDPTLLPFKLHCFAFRGTTCCEAAGIGGAGHLINSRGTDTAPALEVVRDYYHERMAGNSIPAAEHSTITSWGRPHEIDAYANMLRQFPSGFVAVVSDSYDIYYACRELWGKRLKDMVLRRDGVTIIRPDSGYPPEVVVKVLRILGEAYGTTVNAKGYKLLHPKIRIIQGDGITLGMIGDIIAAMKKDGWSVDNVAFGSGGGLLQKLDRDTQSCAFKCSAMKRDGTWFDVIKDPVTDPKKRSIAGRLALVKQNGLYRTVRLEEMERLGLKNELVPVFENGKLLKDWTFSEIRTRAQAVNE